MSFRTALQDDMGWPIRPLVVYARGRRHFQLLAVATAGHALVSDHIQQFLGITRFTLVSVDSTEFHGKYHPPVQCWAVENLEA